MGLSFVGEANFQSCDSLTFYRNDFTHLHTKNKDTSLHLPSCPHKSMLLHVRKEKTHYKSMPVVYNQTNDATGHSTILDWWLVCICLCSTSRMHRSMLSYYSSMSRESPVEQLLADVDEHDVGVYSAVGRKRIAKGKCIGPTMNANSICYCPKDESFFRVWYSYSWRQQVEKVGLQIWAITRLGKPWLGIQTSQKPICAWFWRGPVDRPQRWWRHTTGLETRTIARVASNSDSGCIHHNTSWRLTNHCFSKPQFGET